mgnify:CR=1 FL=1
MAQAWQFAPLGINYGDGIWLLPLVEEVSELIEAYNKTILSFEY